MAFSYTGLAYLLGFFAVGLLTYRFFQYWCREKTTVSKLFFWFSGLFAFFMLITAIAGLFFANNTQVLKWTVMLAAFLQTLALATIGYLIVYLRFPSISPWVGFVSIFLLGLTATALTIIIPFHPYLETSGGINWDVQPLADTLRSFLFLITFLSMIIILIQQFRTSRDSAVKTKAFGMILIMAFGILAGLFDFLLENILKLGTISSEIATGALSITVFIIVFFTQKPPSLKEEKKSAPPTSPQIPW